jgi:Uma2 family endonuclease
MASAALLRDDPFPPQGQWTWEDYLRLPDDGNRYEIVEGVLYMSPAPSFDHQYALFELARLLGNYTREHRLGLVLVAPFDVRLFVGADPVQPDLLFFRPGNLPAAGSAFFQGIPDLIVEVVSPGSTRLDQYIKFGAYEKAKVPEYWLVDPRGRMVTVFSLDPAKGEYQEISRAVAGDQLTSPTFPGFVLPVAGLFP